MPAGTTVVARRRVSIVIAVGMAVGLVSLGLEHLPAPWFNLSAWGGAWLILAFGGGATQPGLRRGATTGLAALVAATGTYYLAKLAFGSPINPLAQDNPLVWVVASIPAGVAGGVLGTTWRTSARLPRIAAVAALAGTVLAEAWWHRDGYGLSALIALVGLVLPVLLLRTTTERAVGVFATVAGGLLIWWSLNVALPVVLAVG